MAKFNLKLTKLVEFTIEKQIFPKHFSISLSKNGKFSPEKINTLRIYFIRNWRFYVWFFQELYYTIVFLNINYFNFECPQK